MSSILAGYPGSVAATWQQFGRAGRRQGTSVAVLVASGAPVDQYVIHHPEFLLEGTPEEARLDPDNLHVLLAHLRAATFELPFEPGEVFGPGPADDLLAFLAEERHVRQAGDGRWYWSSENFPASEISLRTAAPENVVIIDTTPDRPRVLGEVDLFSAQVLVHERAIYIHESVQYYVDRLEWHERKAYVHRVDVDHYTYANRAVTLKPLEVFAEADATGGRRIHGEVMVASLVTLFKKLKFLTDENVGWGPIDLPELELQTTAYWLTADRARDGWRRDDLDVALLGAGRAIQTVASVLLMVDPRDLGLVAQVRSPHAEQPTIYLYEAVPGGIGLSERLWDRHDELLAAAAELIEACGCDGGCPSCTGPRLEPGDRRACPRAAAPGRARGAAGHVRSPGGRMTSPVADRASLARRLDRYRATTHGGAGTPLEATRQVELPHAPVDRGVLAERLARTVGGEVVSMAGGLVVRCTTEPREIPLDRAGLAGLPGQPPPGVPLVCLDTETTGLATATGTVAFLVGLGWWEGDAFHQVQLLLPDHADEPALLTALAGYIPLDGWLVTYNGRGFDWPLLVTRYRMARRAAPLHGGHLDLLPVVRRLFRHRLEDARLRTVETGLLGMVRHGDIDGSEIPGRYLGFLRGGPAEPLAAVVRHNDQDVRSLARLLVLLASGYGTPEARRTAPAGDLGGLARAYARAGRLSEALECYDVAFEAEPAGRRAGSRSAADRAAAARPATPAGTRRRGPVVVATRPGGLRRLATAAHRVRAVGPVRGLRHSLDDRPDRRRARPPAAPPAALGRRRGCLGEPGGRSGPDGHRRRDRARQAPRAPPARPARGVARDRRRPRPRRAAAASRPSRAATGGRPARPGASAATTSGRADRDLSPAGRPGAGAGRGPPLTSATERGRAPDRTSRPSSAGRRPAR